MPAKDIYHETVKTALTKDGWTITDDPFKLKWGLRELFVDLGAKKIIVAQNGERQIVVEIKTFRGHSQIYDLQQCLGQYLLYRTILEESKSEDRLYLAIRKAIYEQIFSEAIGTLVIRKFHLRLLIFDSGREEIVQWIN
ncbi:MAG: XisH family protein [Hormoscilla sp. GUM202]|nr:XisH family protein [Hormoscilla sp. GM7CHS1pb]MBO1346669.1 XisH family protein [Hormoscilla sp. GUM202]